MYRREKLRQRPLRIERIKLSTKSCWQLQIYFDNIECAQTLKLFRELDMCNNRRVSTRICVFFLFLSVLLTRFNALSCQEESKLGFENGAFQTVTANLNAMFKLRTKKNGLALDRESWKSVPAELSRAHAGMFDSADVSEDLKKLLGMFFNLRSVGGARGGGFGGGSSGRAGGRIGVNFRFNNSAMSGSIDISDRALTLILTELDGPRRNLMLIDDDEGKLKLILSGDDATVIINQKADGKLHITGIIGEQVAIGSAESFPELVDRYPDFERIGVFDLLRHNGIKMPLLVSDTRVKQRVISRLVAMEQIQPAKTEKLFADLDSDDFQVRDAATDTFSKNFETYAELIKEKQQEENLSFEVKSRLAQIIKKNSQQDEVSDLISSANLLGSADYLVSLIPKQDKEQVKQAIIRRLKQITKQDFGEDVIAWQQWIEQQRNHKKQ